MSATLDIPLLNQLGPEDPDPNAGLNCGETSIEAVAQYLGLVPAESIPQIKVEELGSADAAGYSDVWEMAAWFQRRGVKAAISQPQNPAAACRAAIRQGYPPILLRWWDLVNKTGGHFIVGYECDDAGVGFNDPYGGYQYYWTDDTVNANCTGYVVIVCQRKPDPMEQDPLFAAAVARYSALGQQPNTKGALFAAWFRRYKLYVASGYDNILDPTPAITPEWNNGKIARVGFDNGEVYEWHPDGKIFLVEQKARAAAFQECGWAA